jgi:hypothetical protein
MSANQTQINTNNANTSYKFKTRKTIELLGQTFEEFALSFPPESTIVAVLHAWNLLQSNLANGIIKESKPIKTSDYQLFGKWLKLNNDTYSSLPITEFSKLQSSLWKQSQEKDDFLNLSEEELRELSNRKPAKKSKSKPSPSDDKPSPSDDKPSVKPSPSDDKPSPSVKPSDVKPKKSKSKIPSDDKPSPSDDKPSDAKVPKPSKTKKTKSEKQTKPTKHVSDDYDVSIEQLSDSDFD